MGCLSGQLEARVVQIGIRAHGSRVFESNLRALRLICLPGSAAQKHISLERPERHSYHYIAVNFVRNGLT